MGHKFDTIMEISSQADHSDKVEIWTSSFVAVGTLVKDYHKISDGLVTLKDVALDTFIEECACDEESCNCSEGVRRDWLNIFEEKIIAFTVFRK